MDPLHVGQVRCSRAHWRRHAVWYSAGQEEQGFTTLSPLSIWLKQMGHSAAAEALDKRE